MFKEILLIVTNPNSGIDPFATKYLGKNVSTDEARYYSSLLEVTSYIWASKGGRGIILEKILSNVAGENASHGIKLSDYLKTRLKKYDMSGTVLKAFNIKFDLINVIDDKLIVLEIKNRIDSGGVSGRKDAHNKFLRLYDEISTDSSAVFLDERKEELTFSQLLKKMGITQVKLLMGLFYNKKGMPATLENDKNDGGFYSTSKSELSKFITKHSLSAEKIDSLTTKMTNNGVDFVLQTIYGDDPIKEFTNDQFTLEDMLQKVFPQTWDDIKLLITVGISQRMFLIKNKTNIFILIREMNESNSKFKKTLQRFSCDSKNKNIICELLTMIKKEHLQHLNNASDQEIVDCLYLCSKFMRYQWPKI